MLLFKGEDLLLGQTVSFKFKVTTVSDLQASIYVSLPVHLAYATLPISLAPREGRNYTHNSNQVRWRSFSAIDSSVIAVSPVESNELSIKLTKEFRLIEHKRTVVFLRIWIFTTSFTFYPFHYNSNFFFSDIQFTESQSMIEFNSDWVFRLPNVRLTTLGGFNQSTLFYYTRCHFKVVNK